MKYSNRQNRMQKTLRKNYSYIDWIINCTIMAEIQIILTYCFCIMVLFTFICKCFITGESDHNDTCDKKCDDIF